MTSSLKTMLPKSSGIFLVDIKLYPFVQNVKKLVENKQNDREKFVKLTVVYLIKICYNENGSISFNMYPKASMCSCYVL